jgi:hypothetical protein
VRPYIVGVGRFMLGLGALGLLGATLGTGLHYGPATLNEELPLLAYTVACIGDIIAGYALVNLTQK